VENLHPSLLKEIRGRKFEIAEDGKLFLPRAKIMLGGKFDVEHIRDGKLIGVDQCDNIVVNEGLNHVLSVIFNGGTQVNPWYVGLFEGNYTPVATDTAANITANSTECTAYNESTRQVYNESAPSGQSLSNSANKATFTMNATKTVYGAFIASASAKSATTGTLMSAARFSAARSVVSSDQLLVTYTFAAADA